MEAACPKRSGSKVRRWPSPCDRRSCSQRPVRRSERHLLWRLHEAGFGSRREDLYPHVRLADLMDGPPGEVVDLPADDYNVSEPSSWRWRR